MRFRGDGLMGDLNVLAVCSGYGGIELGLDLATGGDARTVCWVERDIFVAARVAQRMQEGHFRFAPIHSDIKTFRPGQWRNRVHLVTGGYPCQPFSISGKMRGKEDPRHLWPHVLRVLTGCAAPLLFVENVRGHASKGLDGVLGQLACFGFDAEWDLYSAEETGAPHKRERLFLLAYNELGHLLLKQRWEGLKRPPRLEQVREPEADSVWDGARWEVARPGSSPWQAVPELDRVGDDVADWTNRCRGTGNGVIPIVAARAWNELSARVADRA